MPSFELTAYIVPGSVLVLERSCSLGTLSREGEEASGHRPGLGAFLVSSVGRSASLTARCILLWLRKRLSVADVTRRFASSVFPAAKASFCPHEGLAREERPENLLHEAEEVDVYCIHVSPFFLRMLLPSRSSL